MWRVHCLSSFSPIDLWRSTGLSGISSPVQTSGHDRPRSESINSQCQRDVQSIASPPFAQCMSRPQNMVGTKECLEPVITEAIDHSSSDLYVLVPPCLTGQTIWPPSLFPKRHIPSSSIQVLPQRCPGRRFHNNGCKPQCRDRSHDHNADSTGLGPVRALLLCTAQQLCPPVPCSPFSSSSGLAPTPITSHPCRFLPTAWPSLRSPAVLSPPPPPPPPALKVVKTLPIPLRFLLPLAPPPCQAWSCARAS